MALADAAMQRNDTTRCDYPPAVVDPDNPLVKKLLDIHSQLQEKKRKVD